VPHEKTRLDRIDDVHVLTLSDPDKRNAIGREAARQLVASVAEVAADHTARALVVAAEGPAFCAGADLPDIFGEERPTAAMSSDLRSYYECFLAIRALPIPTFAAVQGAAIGAGLNLALSCDVRFAAPNARFGATFTRIGLHPGGGCTYFLVQAIGRQRALQLLLDGGTLDAEQAVATGLAAAVVADPRAAAIEAAQRAAALEPWLARAIVQAVDIAGTAGFEATLELESWAQAESTHSARFREHVTRFGSVRP
jgi:enoyl-CoA hydratase